MNTVPYFGRPPNSRKCPEAALLPCSTGMHLSLGRAAPVFRVPIVLSVQEAQAAGRSSQETRPWSSRGYSKPSAATIGFLTPHHLPSHGKCSPCIMSWFMKNKGLHSWNAGSSLCIWPHSCLLRVLGICSQLWCVEEHFLGFWHSSTQIQEGTSTHLSACQDRHTWKDSYSGVSLHTLTDDKFVTSTSPVNEHNPKLNSKLSTQLHTK